MIVSLENQARKTKGGVLILPYREFLERLWQGEWEEGQQS